MWQLAVPDLPLKIAVSAYVPAFTIMASPALDIEIAFATVL